MKNSEILDVLQDIINSETKIPKEEIGLGTRLVEDLYLDSFDMVGILMAVEEKIEIQISETDIERVITIEDAVKIIADLAQKL